MHPKLGRNSWGRHLRIPSLKGRGCVFIQVKFCFLGHGQNSRRLYSLVTVTRAVRNGPVHSTSPHIIIMDMAKESIISHGKWQVVTNCAARSVFIQPYSMGKSWTCCFLEDNLIKQNLPLNYSKLTQKEFYFGTMLMLCFTVGNLISTELIGPDLR